MRFLLVDRVESLDPEKGIRGIKNVALSEDYFEHHFPGRPVVPGALLLEALIQLAGWLEAASSDFERWFLVDYVARCGFYDFVVPGDRVEMDVTLEPQTDPGRRSFRGVGLVEGGKRISAEFTGRIVPLSDLEDPDLYRELFARLRRQRTW